MNKLNRVEMVLPFLLVFAYLIVYANQLNFSWTTDDGGLMLLAAQYSPFQYFFDIGYIHGVSPVNFFTPWLVFAYDLNAWLFGANVQGYYFHQLASVALIVWLSYHFFSLFTSKWHAFWGTAIFIAGIPVLVVTQELMDIHYVEGLGFALGSLIGAVYWLRGGKRGFGGLSVVCYCLALCCKEIYAPLPLIMLVLPCGSIRSRLCLVGALSVPGLFYVALRLIALGALADGYTVHFVGSWHNGILIVSRAFHYFWSTPLARLLAAALLVQLMALLLFQRNWKLVLLVMGCLVAGFFPLMFLDAAQIGDSGVRALFFPWWLNVFVITLLIFNLHKKRRLQHILLLGVLSLAVVSNWSQHERFWGLYHGGLVTLYQTIQRSAPADYFVLDGLENQYPANMLNSFQLAFRLRGWPGANGRLVAAGDIIADAQTAPGKEAGSSKLDPAEWAKLSASFIAAHGPLSGEPITVSFEYDSLRHLLYWRGHAQTQGTWVVTYKISPDNWITKGASLAPGLGFVGPGGWHSPGGTKIFWPAKTQPFQFRVWFKSQDGRMSVTPLLQFSPAATPTYVWHS